MFSHSSAVSQTRGSHFPLGGLGTRQLTDEEFEEVIAAATPDSSSSSHSIGRSTPISDLSTNSYISQVSPPANEPLLQPDVALFDPVPGPWTSAEEIAPNPAGTGWDSSTMASMGTIPSLVPIASPYGPAPFPIDSFASQEPYPYALERLHFAPTWSSQTGIPAAQAPYMLFPSSANNVSSAELLNAEAVLPVAYDLPSYVGSALPPTSQPSLETQTVKRQRSSPSPVAASELLFMSDPATKSRPPPSKRQRSSRTGTPVVKEDPEARLSPGTLSSISSGLSFVPTESSKSGVVALRPKVENIPVPKARVEKRRVVRSGPLSDLQKEKIEAVRYTGACWRCRRYKKPCNAGAAICNHCLTSGLRLWPGSVGCRKGDFKIFVLWIIPENAEDVMKSSYPLNHLKPNNWRRPKEPPGRIPMPRQNRADNKWEALYIKMACLNIWGYEVVELLEIAEQLSKASKQHSNLMEAVGTSLSYSADYYFSFVNTVTPEPEPDLIETCTLLRETNVKAWNMVLSTLLSGKLQNWPTAFLGSCVIVCSLIMFTDTMVVMPAEIIKRMWPDLPAMLQNLRDHVYAPVQEMLVVLAKGAKPLKFKCWDWVSATEGDGDGPKVRNPEGMRLMNGDKAAFDAMASLQKWAMKHRHILDNDDWFTSQPFNPTVFPISGMSRFVVRSGGAYD